MASNRNDRSSNIPIEEKVRRFQSIQSQRRQESDPCSVESEISLDCQSSTRFRENCSKEIENFKTCKDFWYRVKKDRIAKGIEPHLPPQEEREEIKKQFMINSKKIITQVLQERERQTKS